MHFHHTFKLLLVCLLTSHHIAMFRTENCSKKALWEAFNCRGRSRAVLNAFSLLNRHRGWNRQWQFYVTENHYLVANYTYRRNIHKCELRVHAAQYATETRHPWTIEQCMLPLNNKLSTSKKKNNNDAGHKMNILK